MKAYLLILCLIGWQTFCFSQQNGNLKKDKKLIAQIKYLNIQYNPDDFARRNFLKFHSVIVEDVRFDTTNIGTWLRYIPIGGLNQTRRINYEKGLSVMLQRCLSKSLTGEVYDTNLYCFIKEFYLFKKDTIKESNSPHANFTQLKVNIECYYEIKDELYPALKIDTSITDVLVVNKKDIGESVNAIITSVFFDVLYKKINKTDIRKIIQKNSINYAALNNYYLSRFNLPILKNETHQRGVYLSFAEFKNDNPSITNFKIKSDAESSTSLYDGEENMINSMKIFGFCDGKESWVSFGNYYFPLLKTGNGFEFFVTLRSNFKFLVDLNMNTGQAFNK